MNSLSKEKKIFKLNGTKSQIKSILKTLIALNKDKTSPNTKYILVSQVKSQIVKMLKRYNRLLKIYWAIDTKNKNYIRSGGVEEYSARDIYNMVSKLLKNDGYKKVCKRTLERDINLLNEMGLFKSKIRRLGKQKGSIAHYRQNMLFAHIHKDIILEYLTQLLKENLKDKKIIGDFDKEDEDENFNYTNLEKFKILSNLNEHNKITQMSHVSESHVINKANISYKTKENSIEMLPKKNVSNKQKPKQHKFERKDVETRLVSTHKISKNYLKQVKECSNNDSTYINALINLETVIIDYQNEYNIEDILEHFLKQFSNRYKNKVWMMMRRRDGVISDYELIWEVRFRDWYPNKYKSGYVVKETYGGNIRLRNKISNTQMGNQISNDLQHKQDKELERIEKEKERRSLELRRREEYLKKLFEQEAQEMQERLRKAREEKELLKKQIKDNMIGTLEKKGRVTSDSMVSDDSLIRFNRRSHEEDNNNHSDYQSISEGFCKPSGPAAVYPRINLKVNYEGFKTTKGLKISLDSLGINAFSNQGKDTIKGKGEVI
ncbi:plasmid maintenance protein (plasmid) [Borrelia miyamotoi]|uniref:plasmid maintenance protein n=1 Tax=Borrelia miyamotoi TaxID=47466 RepID=UPI0022B440DA|nr:plasmid maintenance protein [Borrelia miyamotoi]WAZ71350.1 plasmid maintenance protein [Borrelia miyamotoi]